MIRRTASFVSIAVAAVLVVGCAPASSPSPAAIGDLPDKHVLLGVDEWPGMPPYADVVTPRWLTLTADGRLVVRDRSADAVARPLTQTMLDRPAMEAAWAAALDAGLRTEAKLELPGLFDAPTTFIRMDDGAMRTELDIYALGLDDPAVPAAERQLRRSVAAYLQALAARGGDEPYLPPQVALWVGPAGDDGVSGPVVPWTPSVDLTTIGEPVAGDRFWHRCAVLEGAQAAEVMAAGGRIPSGEPVEQGGSAWRIAIRPIMPDEVGPAGCAQP